MTGTPSPRLLRRVLAACVALALIATACSGSSDGSASTDPAIDETETTTDGDGGTDEEEEEARGVGAPEPPSESAALSSSFTKLTEPGVGGRITSIAFDPTDPDRLFVGGDLLGIALTNDFGNTWDSTTGFASWEIGDITTTPSADGRIWAGTLSGPHASTDGVTWELSRNGMPAVSESTFTLATETVLVDPTDNARLLAFNGNQRNWVAPGAIGPDGSWLGDGSVWQSTNSGNTWEQLSIVAPAGNIRAAAFSSDGTQLFAAVGNRGIFTSTNGGASWTNITSGLPHANLYDVTTHPTEPATAWVALGEGPAGADGNFIAGGIWRTDDGGASWTDANDGLSIVSNATAGNTGSFHQIVVAPTDGDRLYTSNVAPGQAAIYRSDNGGTSWDIIADGSTPRPNAYESALRAFDIGVHPADGDRIAIGSDDALLGSTDGGETWADLTTREQAEGFFSGQGYSGLVSTDIVFNPTNPDDTILLGFDGGNFIQTIDGGVTWRRTIQDISAWGGGVEAAYSPTTDGVIYVLLGQFQNFRGIGISTNGGAGFRLSAGPAAGLPDVGNVPGGATGLAVLPGNGSDIVLTTVGGVLYRSEDGGSSFTSIDGLGTARDVTATPDGTVYVSTDSGLFSSTDSGRGFNGVDATPPGISTLYTSASEPGTVYAIAFREGDGGLYSFDGSGWTRLFDDFFSHGVAVDPTNPNNLAVMTTEPQFNDISSATGVHLSNDGGQTWTIVTDGLPLNRLRTAEFDPANPDRLVVGTTGRGFYEISFEQALQ